MMSTLILTALVTATCVAGDEAGDRKALQGEWKVVAASTGKPDGGDAYLNSVLKFKGNTFQVYAKGKLETTMSFTLASDKTPKQIDLKVKDDALERIVLLPGIYAIDKNQLRLSFTKVLGVDRPTSFDVEPALKIRHVSLTLEKVGMDK